MGDILIVADQDTTDLYSQSTHADSWRLQTFVYGLFLLQTLQTMLATHDSWEQVAFNLSGFDKGVFIEFLWLTVPIITGISGSYGQI